MDINFRNKDSLNAKTIEGKLFYFKLDLFDYFSKSFNEKEEEEYDEDFIKILNHFSITFKTQILLFSDDSFKVKNIFYFSLKMLLKNSRNL